MATRTSSPDRFPGVPPVFVLDSSLSTRNGRSVFGLDLCVACEDVSGFDTVYGAQKIRNVWRIYSKTAHARDTLLINGITFNCHSIQLLSHNPMTLSNPGAPVTKLIVSGIEVSVSNTEIEKALVNIGVKICSPVKMANYRYENGGFSSYRSGKRFIYIELPKYNLPMFIQIAGRMSSLYYKEQIRSQRRDGNNSHHTQSEADRIREDIERRNDEIGVESVTSDTVLDQTGDTVILPPSALISDVSAELNNIMSAQLDPEASEQSVSDNSDPVAPPLSSESPPDTAPCSSQLNTEPNLYTEIVTGKNRESRSAVKKTHDRIRKNRQSSISDFVRKARSVNGSVSPASSPKRSSSRPKRTLDTSSEDVLPPSGKVSKTFGAGEVDWFEGPEGADRTLADLL